LVKVPIYFVSSYYILAEKAAEYQKWLNSGEAQRLYKQFEKETGMKYLNTYFTILGFGDYDCEDWFTAPDWSSLDKIRGSKASDEMTRATWHMMDMTRGYKTRVLRTFRDVEVSKPPPKQ
jgi:hypothetical protein